MSINDIVANLLEEFADKLRAGSCVLDQDQALRLVSNVAHISLNKQEVADRYNISTKTVERREASGELPPGHVEPVSKKKWYLDELIEVDLEKLNSF